MDGREVGRRVVQLQAEARARRGLALLWRGGRPLRVGASAAECLRLGVEPARRLEPLRRRLGRGGAAPAA
ncbi:hypothetical protein GCM10010964_30330 [Caldovatus sediminis]|uniref:Uncharacterized protein n=1 Tax=Caldovatus sediminis TaxID=2041189 RepID=A0A8J2ZDH2_9PROT|nr:hypothetical protein [Caldovatus sediminis]GGG40637.1 hypothetical protein GCM10010964_30330 [Caldovatus sediminis]